MTDPVRPVAPRDVIERFKEQIRLGAMGYAERFEAVSERFYRETGFLAPGKSVPVEMWNTAQEERRTAAWEAFQQRERETFYADLQFAIDTLAAAHVPCAASPADRELIQRFISAAERYRIHSELLFNAPIDITVDMLKARDELQANLPPRATGEGARDATDCPIHGSAWCSCKRAAEYSGRLNRLVESLRCPTCGTAVYQPNERCTAHGEQTNGQLEHQHSGHRVTPQSGESEGRESDGQTVRGGTKEGGAHGGDGDVHARRQGGHPADAPPVAVALDPHRLSEVAERLHDFLAKWVHGGRLQTFGDRERFRTEARIELARLRGEAAVRPENDDVKICTFCAKGQPAFQLQSGTGNLWHRNETGQLYKCIAQIAKSAAVRVEDQS